MYKNLNCKSIEKDKSVVCDEKWLGRMISPEEFTKPRKNWPLDMETCSDSTKIIKMKGWLFLRFDSA